MPTENEEAGRLLRLFTLTFPGGRAGAGLLLLRAALGSTSVINGGNSLFGPDGTQPFSLVAGGLALAGGTSLLLGCLTPVACLLAGLSSAAATSPWWPSAVPLDNGTSLLFVLSLTAAVVLLGPGAFSLDAHLFGRREVIIPQASRTPKL